MEVQRNKASIKDRPGGKRQTWHERRLCYCVLSAVKPREMFNLPESQFSKTHAQRPVKQSCWAPMCLDQDHKESIEVSGEAGLWFLMTVGKCQKKVRQQKEDERFEASLIEEPE